MAFPGIIASPPGSGIQTLPGVRKRCEECLFQGARFVAARPVDGLEKHRAKLCQDRRTTLPDALDNVLILRQR